MTDTQSPPMGNNTKKQQNTHAEKLTVYQISDLLKQNIDRLVREYLPNAKLKNNEYRGSLDGKKNGDSFVMKKNGEWYDHKTKQGGNIIQYFYNRHNGDKAKGIAEAKQFLGIGDNDYIAAPATPTTEQIEKQKAEQDKEIKDKDKKTLSIVKNMWDNTKPIIGTLGEKYFNARGIDLNKVGDISHIRFITNAWYSSRIKECPCIIAITTNTQNEITGCIRIFLNKDSGTTGKAKAKKQLGRTSGTGVRLYANLKKPQTTVTLTEGLETALAVKMSYPNKDVIGTLSTSGMTSLAIDENITNVTIAADKDESKAGEIAAQKTANKLIKQGIKTNIYLPKQCKNKDYDFNDALIEHGDATMENLIKIENEKPHLTLVDNQETEKKAFVEIETTKSIIETILYYSDQPTDEQTKSDYALHINNLLGKNGTDIYNSFIKTENKTKYKQNAETISKESSMLFLIDNCKWNHAKETQLNRWELLKKYTNAFNGFHYALWLLNDNDRTDINIADEEAIEKQLFLKYNRDKSFYKINKDGYSHAEEALIYDHGIYNHKLPYAHNINMYEAYFKHGIILEVRPLISNIINVSYGLANSVKEKYCNINSPLEVLPYTTILNSIRNAGMPNFNMLEYAFVTNFLIPDAKKDFNPKNPEIFYNEGTENDQKAIFTLNTFSKEEFDRPVKEIEQIIKDGTNPKKIKNGEVAWQLFTHLNEIICGYPTETLSIEETNEITVERWETQPSLFALELYAYQVQNPGFKTRITMIYKGESGSGKTAFLDKIDYIFNNKKRINTILDGEKIKNPSIDDFKNKKLTETELSTPKQTISTGARIQSITGRFNDNLEGKIHITVNETSSNNKNADMNALKNIITDEGIEKEGKFKAAKTKTDYLSYTFTTNIHLDIIDNYTIRRFFVVSNKLKRTEIEKKEKDNPVWGADFYKCLHMINSYTDYIKYKLATLEIRPTTMEHLKQSLAPMTQEKMNMKNASIIDAKYSYQIRQLLEADFYNAEEVFNEEYINITLALQWLKPKGEKNISFEQLTNDLKNIGWTIVETKNKIQRIRPRNNLHEFSFPSKWQDDNGEYTRIYHKNDKQYIYMLKDGTGDQSKNIHERLKDAMIKFKTKTTQENV